MERVPYILVLSPRFERILKTLKRKQPNVFKTLTKKVEDVVQEPTRGKPLRNVLRSYRRVHLGSFVLVYEIREQEVRMVDFDHHDRIYKPEV